jgi:FtsP/CotA-like multicopper oxidase with cupredoxin domain
MSRSEKAWGRRAKFVDLHRRLSILILCFELVPVHVFGRSNTIADPPQVRGPLQLAAVRSSETGKMSFYYGGQETAPTIRVSPGEDIRIHYVNDLPERNDEECVLTPCMDMTNLHFHGLHVSPNAPQDDALTMLGQSLDYRVAIPKTMPPGLYWYHTHPHGESYRQALDGMSGAIVIEGMDRYYPELRMMRERILVLRSRELQKTDLERMSILRNVSVSDQPCGTGSSNDLERVFTVNGQLRPQIPIGDGERQFWRIVNASPDLYADLQVDGRQLEIVALDGVPLSFHDRSRRPRRVTHVLEPPTW